MNKHKKHPNPDLVDAIQHIVYEIWKYKQSVADYRQLQRAGGDAAVEFRVLHHRVLLEFFYGPPKHPDNIVAWEYIDDWQQTHCAASVAWFDRYMKRCHTMLAHISTQRSEMAKLRREDWGADWQIVEPHLDKTIREFVDGLSTEHRRVCLQWANQMRASNGVGCDVLDELIAFIRPE